MTQSETQHGYTAYVVTASTRAARGEYADRTGPLIVKWCRNFGFETADASIVPDGPDVGAALSSALAFGADLVLVTGGTGIAPTDTTPESVAPLLDVELPGIMEDIRERGRGKVPGAALTRGVAGFAGRALVVTLPGSVGGVKDGLAVLDGLVLHALDQRRGGDHR